MPAQNEPYHFPHKTAHHTKMCILIWNRIGCKKIKTLFPYSYQSTITIVLPLSTIPDIYIKPQLSYFLVSTADLTQNTQKIWNFTLYSCQCTGWPQLFKQYANTAVDVLDVIQILIPWHLDLSAAPFLILFLLTLLLALFTFLQFTLWKVTSIISSLKFSLLYLYCNILMKDYRGTEVYVHQWPGELYWQKHKPLVGPLVPDRSKGRVLQVGGWVWG
jgi:hypothetical protein